MKKKIAIIGGGVAGITAAEYLQDIYEVHIYEKNNYLGGHTNTFEISTGEDKGLLIDTGFIVLNDKTYPNLHQLFKHLKVPVRYADMSFSYYSQRKNFSYSGKNLSSMFCDKKNLFKISFYKFLAEIYKFSTNSLLDIQKGISVDLSLGDYLTSYKYSDHLIENYILPMGAAIWSTSSKKMLEFPAYSLISFFKNHGLLSFKDRPQWQTVVGGSRKYVDKFREKFTGKIILDSLPIIEKVNDNFVVINKNERLEYDQIIFAVHADEVLNLLRPTQNNILNAHNYENLFNKWTYNLNTVLLHTDLRAMPKNKNCWASWNYLDDLNTPNSLYVSYYMNLLMGFKSKLDYIVSLNCPFEIDPTKLLYKIDYQHPLFTTEAVKTQKEIAAINGENGIWFCGSYMNYGFHEDATTSALEVVNKINRQF